MEALMTNQDYQLSLNQSAPFSTQASTFPNINTNLNLGTQQSTPVINNSFPSNHTIQNPLPGPYMNHLNGLPSVPGNYEQVKDEVQTLGYAVETYYPTDHHHQQQQQQQQQQILPLQQLPIQGQPPFQVNYSLDNRAIHPNDSGTNPEGYTTSMGYDYSSAMHSGSQQSLQPQRHQHQHHPSFSNTNSSNSFPMYKPSELITTESPLPMAEPNALTSSSMRPSFSVPPYHSANNNNNLQEASQMTYDQIQIYNIQNRPITENISQDNDISDNFIHQENSSAKSTMNMSLNEQTSNSPPGSPQLELESKQMIKSSSSSSQKVSKVTKGTHYIKTQDFKKNLMAEVQKTISDGLSLSDLAKKYQLINTDKVKKENGEVHEDDSSDGQISAQEKDKYRNIFCVRCLYEIAVEYDPASGSPKSEHGNGAGDHDEDEENDMQDQEGHWPNSHLTSGPRGRYSNMINNIKDCVQRSHVYAAYHYASESVNVEPFGPSIAGKLIRIAFPSIKTKRLGTRGKSKYHYTGIKIKKKYEKLIAEAGDDDIEKLIKVSTVSPRTTSLVNAATLYPMNLENTMFDAFRADAPPPRKDPYSFNIVDSLPFKSSKSYSLNMIESIFKQCILSGDTSLAVDQLIEYTLKNNSSLSDDVLCDWDTKLYYSTLRSLVPITFNTMTPTFNECLLRTVNSYADLLKERLEGQHHIDPESELMENKHSLAVWFIKVVRKFMRSSEHCGEVAAIMDDSEIRKQMVLDLNTLDFSIVALDLASGSPYTPVLKTFLLKQIPNFLQFVVVSPEFRNKFKQDSSSNAVYYEPYSSSSIVDQYTINNHTESQKVTMLLLLEFLKTEFVSFFGDVDLRIFDLVTRTVSAAILENVSTSSPTFFPWWTVKLWLDDWVSCQCKLSLFRARFESSTGNFETTGSVDSSTGTTGNTAGEPNTPNEYSYN